MKPETAPPGLLRRLGAAGPVAIVLSIWPPLGGFILLVPLTRLGPWLRLHETSGLLIYFLGIGLLLGVSFVPTYACAILAGWAFGFATGFPLAMVTIVFASWLAYAIGRWISRDRVLAVIRGKPSWDAIHRALLGGKSARTTFVVGLLRLSPASPFGFVNFVLAAARVPLLEYTLGTFAGMVPRTALATFAAAGLEQLRFKDVAQRWAFGAGLAATAVACIILGFLAKRALRGLATDVDSAPAAPVA